MDKCGYKIKYINIYVVFLDDDANELFKHITDSPSKSFDDFECRDLNLQSHKSTLQRYFSPFTLEFSLLGRFILNIGT